MHKKQLTFRISANSFAAALFQGDEMEVLFQENFQSKTEQACKDQLKKAIETAGIMEMEMDEFSLSWFTPNSTLIPSNVFSVSQPKTLYDTCFVSPDGNNEIDFNRISELSLVNVYDIPFWVKSFFVIRFPRIVIQHETSHLLRGIFSKSTFKPAVHVSLQEDSFQLVVVKHNQLLFYNTFSYTNEADIIYYISFTIQQLNWKENQTQLHGYGFDVDTFLQIQNQLKRIEIFRSWQEVSHSSTLKFQNTCV